MILVLMRPWPICGGRVAEVKPEDVARLSPLSHEHINVLGRYSFALADSIAGGELRPLLQPDDHGDLAAGAAERTFLFR